MKAFLALLIFIRPLIELYRLIVQAIEDYKKNKGEEWVLKEQETTRAVQEAKTDAERQALAKRVSDSIRDMP